MQLYLESIKLSLATNNYFGAIAMALTLPDICASIEAEDNETNRTRYCDWFDKYLSNKYPPNGDKIMFSSKECYAARCSFLHQGTNITSHQKILKGVDKAAPSVSFMTNTIISQVMRSDQKVTLDIHYFCNSMIDSVKRWMKDHIDNEVVCLKISNLPEVATSTRSLPNCYSINAT